MKEENVTNLKNRILSGVTALAIAIGGYVVATPTNAYASGHKYGTYVSETTGYEYNTYKVEEEDLTASNLSSKVLRYFINKKQVPKEDLEYFRNNPNASCRFWPVIVYLYTTNEEGKKVREYHTRTGENIKFPKTYEEMKQLNIELKKSGWLANYCKKHNIYPKKKTVYLDKEYARSEIIKILAYTSDGDTICADDDTVAAYLKTLGDAMNIKYVYKEGAKLDKNQDWQFHEWLLTPDEIIYPGKKPKVLK